MNMNLLSAFTGNTEGENRKIKDSMATVNSTALVFAYTILINSFLEFKVSRFFIFITSVLIIYSLYKWDRNRKRAITYIIIASIAFVFILGGYLSKTDFVSGLKNWFQWIIYYDYTEEYYINSMGRFTCILIEIALSIIFYLLHSKNKLRIITALVLISGCILLAVNEVLVPKITVVITIYYIMWVIAQNCGYKDKKSISEVDNSLAAAFLAPVCLILSIVILIFPAPEKPLSWNGVIRIFEKAQEGGALLLTKLEYFFDANGSIFSLSEAGYTEEETELGGSVSSGNKISMIVSARNKSTAGAYLEGSISDVYTGRGWEKSKEGLELSDEILYYDFYNLVIAIAKEKEAGVDVSNLMKGRNLQIKFHNIRTRSIFIPLKTYWIKINNSLKYDETQQGSLILKKARSSGMEYELKFYEMNMEHPSFKEMLIKNNSHITPGEATIHKVLEEVFDYPDRDSILISEKIYKELKLQEEYMQHNYTKLPEDLPSRVKSLAVELTKEASSDYERLKILETYLNTFKYTTNMNKTPKGEDFVDYFLFRQKEGYCTYFASAMGVMARALNIPTRYVEGFVLNYKEKEGDSNYIIKSNNAHAWVEAYISGVGWIPFEPTPGFYNSRYTAWKEYGANSLHSDNTSLITPAIPDSYESYGYNGDAAAEVSTGEGAKVRSYFLKGLFVILTGFILCIFMFYFSYIIAGRRYKKLYMKSEDNEKFIMDFKKILRYLHKDGYELSEDITLLEFSKKIEKNYNFKSISFTDLGALFMKVRYGEKELTKAEVQSVSDLTREYEIYLKDKIGFFEMFFHEFKFLHFYQ